MINNKKNDCININVAATKLGVKRAVIYSWIEEGKLETQNGCFSYDSIDAINKIINAHISLESYLKSKEIERFDYRYAKNREKYIDFLEKNDFFGVKVVYADEFPYPYENRVTLYIQKKDLEKLDKNSKEFFEFFGLSEKDKCQLYIEECSNDTTKRLLTEYVMNIDSFVPSATSFVRRASKVNVCRIKDKNIDELIKDLPYEASKDLMISFINYAKKELSLDLGEIKRKPHHTSKDIGAYPYRTFVVIAKALFNEDEIKKNRVIEKALENPYSFETWLFLSAHYVCGWRTYDICENWPIPDKKTLTALNINVNTLKEDILGEKISEDKYRELGAFIEKKIQLAAVKPHKTKDKKKASDLLAPIDDALKLFFGRMALIAVYHKNLNNTGRMKSNRSGEYLNFVRFKELFGNEVYSIIGRNHLSSKKLNKSFLQCLEARGRKDGLGTMVASSIASFARNHANFDTIAMYIHDHGLDGESAEVVLSMMLDRGVFGTIRYNELLAAFPDAFNKLTAKEQTRVMAECESSSYELEIMGAELIAEQTLKESFAEGNVKDSLAILREMFEIAQGFGKAKDEGVYCKKRAVGEACDSPSFESCIANVCPYLVFSEAGIKSLIKVINLYNVKAKSTKNPKYISILEKVIVPAYKEILKEISKRMSSSERDALKKAIGEYYAEYIKPD